MAVDAASDPLLDLPLPDGKREFSVTELDQQVRGRYTPSVVKFSWSADRQSAPRGWWDNPVKLRTVREDYPGSDLPSEQVLGPNFEPFTLSGVWDDRYNSAGFAEATWKAFEEMVQRGNMCRFQYGNVVIHGIVTSFTPSFMQANSKGFYRIGYKFTVSPHFRKEGGDLRDANARKNLAPQAKVNPQTYVDNADALRQQAAFLNKRAPFTISAGTSYGDITQATDDISNKVDATQLIVAQRVLPLVGPNSVERLAQSFISIQSSAAAILDILAPLRTDTGLFFESALGNLSFEVWCRQMATVARALLLQASLAAADLFGRVQPDALALYRPQVGESLYAISQRFYKTPHGWRDIYLRNHLQTFTLGGTELLVIPSSP